MTTWIALLRGVNVGGNRRVPMAELRAALEGIGLQDVRTYIVSGNVLFRAALENEAALTTAIEGAIERRFGFPVAVVLRSAAELRAIVASDPLPEGSAGDPRRRYVVFLSAVPAPHRLADGLHRSGAVPSDGSLVGPIDQACYPWPIAAVAMLPCGRPLLELTVRLQ